MRLGGRKQTLKVIKEFDAFPKIPENYQQTTASGGSVSLVSFLFIFVLVISEFWYYRATETKFSYEVDTDADSKLQINVDLTIAMKCEDIDADVLDLSGSTMQLGDSIKLEPTFFKLTPEQEMWLTMFRDFHFFYEGYRSLGEMDEFNGDIPTYMPKREESKDAANTKEHDACRVYGSFKVNKVAGNFHITSGKSIHHPRGHAHLSSMVPVESLNFSHRIDMLSFGKRVPGIVHPLDGEMQITEKRRMMYQYYIQVVPTSIKSLNSEEIKTNQYSMTQRIREISHDSGSHGIAGLFFKYDMSSIMVRVKHQHHSMVGFLVRLCGIVGGIFATSGMLHDFIGFLFNMAMCRFGYNKKRTELPADTQVPPDSPSAILSQAKAQENAGRPMGIPNDVTFSPAPSSPVSPSYEQNTKM
ncbi:predicted protein [Nematostella vectensis]|uniref:Endoplasmic reticulum-Golgi intermediate compartment protein 2 n=1 Tax=Nematostella vectensis TaxID=45351 RepID=A7RLP6_NEMVE|nr:predicted protein [Nematostella vectensis]|eukprot:XP_001639791.1 predicted protein [Nematostella vectensis]